MELLVLKTKQVGPSGNAPEPHKPGSLSPAHCRSSPLSGRGFRPQTAAFRVLRRQVPRGRRRGGGLGPDYGGRVARGTGPTGQGGGARAGPAAMGNLFGRKKQSRVTEQDKAILQLKQQRDKLKQYQKRITQQLEREREIARQLLRDGRKERAKLLLKKKRYREQLLDKTENQITSLETMVQSIEFTQIEMKVIEGLKIGNECLNKMHQVMSVEEVERILDETQEAVDYQRQIDELLAGSFTQEDEDAILEELDAITQEQIELPAVPSEPLPEKIPGTRLVMSFGERCLLEQIMISRPLGPALPPW
uniref:Charged multivesicular body protein 6 n=1 Tax=Bos mutus grunniens TaxID=30521 RepID=A0A8B9YKV2_BOSMU